MELNKIYLGDCLEVMDLIDDKSIDMVLCDLPYGMTACEWDIIIPLDKLWKQYKRIIKNNGIIALTASQPFTSMLVMSNIKMFKHEWIWIKNRGSNFANTVREPMKEHEQILIFSCGNWTYNKQMQKRVGGGLNLIGKKVAVSENKRNGIGKFKEFKSIDRLPKFRVPSSLQRFNTEVGMHPTQKPVALFEYLIKTYTNKNNIVLDNCIGSGTTAIAAIRTRRNYIGIEKSEEYYNIANKRIEDELKQLTLDV
jgi:site-specific DNA-methyltransferase (adenine-specific)